MTPETFKLVMMLLTVVFSNAVSVAVIRALLKNMEKRLDSHDEEIGTIKKDTRHVMSGNEIRRILHEQVDPLKQTVEEIHDDVLVMRTRLRTREGDVG